MSFLKNSFKKLKEINSSTAATKDVNENIPSKTEGIDASSWLHENTTPTNAHSHGNTIRKRLSRIPALERFKSVDEKVIIETRTPDTSRVSCEGSSNERAKTGDKGLAITKKKLELQAGTENRTFVGEDRPELTKLYKPYSMNMSKKWHHENRILFKDIDFEKLDGEIICFRARIHALRRMSAKLLFMVFRQQTITIQGVLQSFKKKEDLQVGEDNTGTISEQMVRCIEHYPSETIVVVYAKVRRALQRVKNATIHDHELEVYEVHKLGDLTENVPFSVYDAENINGGRGDDDAEDDWLGEYARNMSPSSNPSIGGSPCSPVTEGKCRSMERSRHHSLDSADAYRAHRSLPQKFRLNNRIIDLRTGPSQAIFRVQSGICHLFRSYLDTKGFIEIHTPKLQGGATETGATVFELNYFGRPAFLAQSPQLAKQMCIAADFERVYEIGPVFRAEDSNTPRHLTEFTGLDLEMAFEEHYHEALAVIDGMFKNLWQGIYDRYKTEIDLISKFYPHDKIQWLKETPRISFSEGVRMLKEDGWVDEEGNPPSEYEDLATRAERRLGALVKQKYNTDYYILDKFPASARPFYTMPDPSDDRITNSFDIFMRGQEILSGGQRIHDGKFLEQRMEKLGIKPDSMLEYMEGFRWGAPPHAGCGIGLERLTYLFLNLGNIRLASLFPRDPKSLPAKPTFLQLRHPEASTTHPPWESVDVDPTKSKINLLQPLEKLIANYGDAANTSWLDVRYHVWRHPGTGAAQGYVIQNNHAIAVGEPLCAEGQYSQVVPAFLRFLSEKHADLKPLWLIIGSEMEEILGEKFGWRTIGCIAEERADPRNKPTLKDKDLARKVRHAEKEGLKHIDVAVNQLVPHELQLKIDQRIQDWQHSRKGAQVHLTQIRPWIDPDHRRYFYSQTADGTIHALVVLHQLSPQNGYQVKFSLEFPSAPSGTIESLILHSFKAITVQDPEVNLVTFGTGAMPKLFGGRNLGKAKMKALTKAYEGICTRLKLTNKSEFREKMGVWNEGVFVAYPRGGLGAGGIRAILGLLQAE